MGKKAKVDYEQQAETVKGTIEPTADENLNNKIRAVVGTFGGDNTEQEFLAQYATAIHGCSVPLFRATAPSGCLPTRAPSHCTMAQSGRLRFETSPLGTSEPLIRCSGSETPQHG